MDASVAAHLVLREEPRQTVLLPLDRIDIGERLRTVNGATVQHLAESMKRNGLQNPIQVCESEEDSWLLVSGAHRLQAARSLAWPSIEVFVLDSLDDDTLSLLEIDENLMRAELNPLDRGRFLAKRKEIYERLYPETKGGGDRRSEAFQQQREQLSNGEPAGTVPKNFVAETSSITPFSSWTIRRAIRIGEKIEPELREELAMTPLAYREGDLVRISDLPSEEQFVLLDDLQSAEHEVNRLSDIYPRKPEQEAPEEGGGGAEPAPETPPEKTVLERVQALWIAASDEEQLEIVAWIELMKGYRDASPPAAS